MTRPYLAASLRVLRDEINAKWPDRDKRSDGWIGDPAHAARKSDHNPDESGCVHAIDVDRDGIEVKKLLRAVVGDSRVWYVISDRVIWSRTNSWHAKAYTGANPHVTHVHISALHTAAAERDVSRWFDRPRPPAPDGTGHPSGVVVGGVARPVLRLGTRGSHVQFLQRMIGVTPPSGVFDARTEARVKWYQRQRGIAVDGIVGPRTWREIAKMT